MKKVSNFKTFLFPVDTRSRCLIRSLLKSGKESPIMQITNIYWSAFGCSIWSGPGKILAIFEWTYIQPSFFLLIFKHRLRNSEFEVFFLTFREPAITYPGRRGSLQLWQFLVSLLQDPANNQQVIAWTGRGLEFKLIEPEEVNCVVSSVLFLDFRLYFYDHLSVNYAGALSIHF